MKKRFIRKAIISIVLGFTGGFFLELAISEKNIIYLMIILVIIAVGYSIMED